MATDRTQDNPYLAAQVQAGQDFSNMVTEAQNFVGGLGQGIVDTVNNAGDRFLGAQLANAYTEQAMAEANMSAMGMCWAGVGVPADYVENLMSGGDFAQSGQSHYLDMVDQAQTHADHANELLEQANLAQNGGLSALEEHNATEASKSEKQAENTASTTPDASDSAQAIPDVSGNFLQGIFRSGLIAGTIPAAGLSADKLNDAFGVGAGNLLDKVSEMGDDFREKVDAAKIDYQQQQLENQMGA